MDNFDAVPAQEAPRCKWAYRAERSTDVAQSCTFSEDHEGKCSFDMAAEPQAGAQTECKCPDWFIQEDDSPHHAICPLYRHRARADFSRVAVQAGTQVPK